MDVLQLVGIESADPLDLGDDLVASTRDVETVHEVAADQSAQVAGDLPQVEAQAGDLVPVDDELGLGLVDLDVDQRREGEHPALHGLPLQLVGELQDLPGFRRRRQDEFHREIAAAGEGRRRRREDPDPGDLLELLLDGGQDLEDVPLPFAPRLDDHSAETGVGEGDLEGEVAFRLAQEDAVDLRGVDAVLVEG